MLPNPLLRTKFILLISCGLVLFLLSITALFNRTHRTAEEMIYPHSPLTGGDVSNGYGKRNTSPIFYDSRTGKPYLRTWTIIWNSGDDVLSKYFGPSFNKETAWQQSAQSFDLAIGSHIIMKSQYNPSGISIAPYGNNLISVTKDTDFWNQLVNYANDPGHNITIGEIFGGSTSCNPCSLDMTNSKVPAAAASYYGSPAVMDSLISQGYKGGYWDSGQYYSEDPNDKNNYQPINHTLNQNYSQLWNLIQQAYRTRGLTAFDNSAAWTSFGGLRNIFAPFVGGSIEEHFFFNGWKVPGAAMISQISKLGWYKSNTPNLTMLLQGGRYEDCSFFTSWSPRGSYALAQRLQMTSLANFYAIEDLSLNMYYRYSGVCNDTTDNNGSPSAWFRDERGEVPYATAYNVGQPKSGFTSLPNKVHMQGIDSNSGQLNSYDVDVVTREFDNARIYLREEQPFGWASYDQTHHWDIAQPYFNERSMSGAIALPDRRMILGYDGSLIGPIDKIYLMQAEGTVLPKPPIKADSFIPIQFQGGTSVSKWNSSTITGGTRFIYPALTSGDFYSSNIGSRSTKVVLVKDAGNGTTVTIDYLNNLSLPVTSDTKYDLDTGTFMGSTVENKTKYFNVNVDTGALPPFNAPARLTISGAQLNGITDPVIFKGASQCTDCVVESFKKNSEIVFRVSGFSNYAIAQKGAAAPKNSNPKKTATIINTSNPAAIATATAQSAASSISQGPLGSVTRIFREFWGYIIIFSFGILAIGFIIYWSWYREKRRLRRINNQIIPLAPGINQSWIHRTYQKVKDWIFRHLKPRARDGI